MKNTNEEFKCVTDMRYFYLHFSVFAKTNRRNIFKRLCSILKHKLPIFNLKLWHSILCAQDLAKTDRFGMASQKFNFPASAALFFTKLRFDQLEDREVLQEFDNWHSGCFFLEIEPRKSCFLEASDRFLSFCH